jgi:tRNA A-37 threonylcarbamoyl transferase component Bud32
MIGSFSMRDGRIGNYRIVSAIGEGGMGAVYRVEHAMLGRPAAVKVLLPEFSRNQEMVNRFFNEARATAGLRHPNIIDVFDFGYCDDGAAFIVMELLHGESLKARLQRVGRLPWQHAVYYARQVAVALAAAHRAHVIHRDLKPDNIFLVPDEENQTERVKVLDFGIAKLAADASGTGVVKTRAGVIMGTPTYMSPQQCRGAGEVDHRTDIYSLGCMFFEMVCGRPPFVGEGVGELLSAHMSQPPPSPRAFEPSIPVELEATIMRTLAKSEAERHGSMDELIFELDRLVPRTSQSMSTIPQQAHVASTVVQSNTTLSGSAGQSLSGHTAAAPTAGGRRTGIIVGAVIATVVGVVAIILATSGGRGTGGSAANTVGAAAAKTEASSKDEPRPPAAPPVRKRPKFSVVELSDEDVATLEKEEAKRAKAAAAGRASARSGEERVATGSQATVGGSDGAANGGSDVASGQDVAVASGSATTEPAAAPPPANDPVVFASMLRLFGSSPLLRTLVVSAAENFLPAAAVSGEVTIRIESNPSRATVLFGDEVIGKTPMSMKVERGAYEMYLSIEQPGFAARELVVVPLVDVVERVKLDSLIKLRIVTKPPAAEVVVDGEVIGIAPLEIEVGRSTEPQTFAFRLAGYLDKEVEIVPAKNSTTTVALEREPQKLVHEIDSTPSGAEVLLGEQVLGKTPLEVEFMEEKGKSRDYRLRIPDDSRYAETRVRLPADKATKKVVRMRDVCAGKVHDEESTEPSLVNPYDPCRAR